MSNHNISRRSVLAASTVAATTLALLPLEFVHAQDVEGQPFGFVEIGGSGVKSSVVRIVRGADNALELLTVREFPTVEANAVDRENAERVGIATRGAVADLRGAGLSDDRIIIVGSSGVAINAAAKAAVDEAVRRLVAPFVPLFVTVDQEVSYTFDGVVNRVRLAHRRPQVVLVDIGSGNTKGGYVTNNLARQEEFHIFQMPEATKSFRQIVQREMGDTTGREAEGAGAETFAAVARRLADTSLRESIRTMLVAAGPVLAQRNRVYLNGGIGWALATSQNPLNTDRYVPVTADQVRNFHALAVNSPERMFPVDPQAITNAAHRTLITRDVASMTSGRIFTPEEFIAGAEILRVLSEEMAWDSKRIFFTRPGRLAWIIGVAFAQATQNNGTISNVVLPV